MISYKLSFLKCGEFREYCDVKKYNQDLEILAGERLADHHWFEEWNWGYIILSDK